MMLNQEEKLAVLKSYEVKPVKTDWGTRIEERQTVGGRAPEADEIYRIDFELVSNGTVWVRKMGKDRGGQFLMSTTVYSKDFKLDESLKLLESRGWTVRRYIFQYDGEPFNPGARAFRGQPWPIRRMDVIKDMRDKMTEFSYQRRGESGFKTADGLELARGLDLAYDL